MLFRKGTIISMVLINNYMSRDLNIWFFELYNKSTLIDVSQKHIKAPLRHGSLYVATYLYAQMHDIQIP